MNEAELKQLEKELNLSGGQWTHYKGIEAEMEAKKVIDKIPEGQKFPVNGWEGAYAVKKDEKIYVHWVCGTVAPGSKIELGVINNE